MPYRSPEELAAALSALSTPPPNPADPADAPVDPANASPDPAEATPTSQDPFPPTATHGRPPFPSRAHDPATAAPLTTPIPPAADWRFPPRHQPPTEPRPIRLRRTAIPLLLTLGLLSLALGIAQWCVDPIEAFSASSLRWSALTLPPLGLILLGLAALNMRVVHRWQQTRRPHLPPQASNAPSIHQTDG